MGILILGSHIHLNMSLSKEDKMMVVGGGAAILAAMAGFYAYMSSGSQVVLDDVVEEKLPPVQIAKNTVFSEKTLKVMSHDRALTQEEIIDSLNDKELFAKVKANIKA